MNISNSWLIRSRQSSTPEIRLFCFPYAGAGAGLFSNRAQEAMPGGIELCYVQYPGRWTRSREPLLTDIRVLAPMLGEALAPTLDIPCVFFGHSMGALVAFELARLFRAWGLASPRHLFVSGCGAPHLFANARRPWHLLPDDELIAELRRLAGTPLEILENDELLKLFLPVLRADFLLCHNYSYIDESPLDCSISAMGGTHDDGTPVESLVYCRKHTNSSFSVSMFEGGHFFVHTSENQVLQRLSGELRAISDNL